MSRIEELETRIEYLEKTIADLSGSCVSIDKASAEKGLSKNEIRRLINQGLVQGFRPSYKVYTVNMVSLNNWMSRNPQFLKVA